MCLFVILGVDLLHMVNVFDEFFVEYGICLRGKISEVRLHRLLIHLVSLIDFQKGKVGSQSYPKEIHLQTLAVFSHMNSLLFHANLEKASIRKLLCLRGCRDVCRHSFYIHIDVKIELF